MELEKACGCIIIENKKVLVLKENKGHWGFPKGHVEEGETEKETAIREVKEETNLDVIIENNKRYTMEYVTDKGNQKEVVFFLAKKIGGKEKKQDSEISQLKWVSYDEAMNIFTYQNTKDLFKKVLIDIK